MSDNDPIGIALQIERRRILRELEKLRARAVDACVGPPKVTAKSKEQARYAAVFLQAVITAMGIVAGVPIAKPGVDYPGSEVWKRDEDHTNAKTEPTAESNTLSDKATLH